MGKGTVFLGYSYIDIRRIRLMHLLFVTQTLDYRCLTTEVEQLDPIVHRTDILSEDNKIICASLVQSKFKIKNG